MTDDYVNVDVSREVQLMMQSPPSAALPVSCAKLLLKSRIGETVTNIMKNVLVMYC